MRSKISSDGPPGFDFARDVRVIGNVLTRYTLPAGTTLKEAGGWAEAFIHDHPCTAVEAVVGSDGMIRVTVFQVWSPVL